MLGGGRERTPIPCARGAPRQDQQQGAHQPPSAAAATAAAQLFLVQLNSLHRWPLGSWTLASATSISGAARRCSWCRCERRAAIRCTARRLAIGMRGPRAGAAMASPSRSRAAHDPGGQRALCRGIPGRDRTFTTQGSQRGEERVPALLRQPGARQLPRAALSARGAPCASRRCARCPRSVQVKRCEEMARKLRFFTEQVRECEKFWPLERSGNQRESGRERGAACHHHDAGSILTWQRVAPQVEKAQVPISARTNLNKTITMDELEVRAAGWWS